MISSGCKKPAIFIFKGINMKITYKDYSEDLKSINENTENPMEKYSLDIDGELKKPGALKVIDMLDREVTFEERAEFVREMLLGCKITVNENGKKIFELAVTPGVQWWAVQEFEDRPFALKYVVNSVYARFLKNFAV